MNKLVPVVALVAACWSLNAFGATAVVCPETPAADEDSRQFTVTPNTDGAGKPVCYLWGDGNLAAGNGSDAILAADPAYVYMDKNNESGGAADGALTAIGTFESSVGLGEKGGTFYVDPIKLTGFSQFIVAFTLGDGNVSPRWAAYQFFNIAECTLANPCDWASVPAKAGDLSHATLYGVRSVVPIPAAVWLFGSGLLGLFAAGRRRKLNVAAE